jgi:hypothetical protein
MKTINTYIVSICILGVVVDISYAKGLDDYVSITGVSSYDQMSVDSIDGAELTFDPVLSAGLKVILFPDKEDKHWYNNITLGYGKSFSRNEVKNEGYQESEQLNLEIPFPKTNFTLRYDKNTYTTSIQAVDRRVYLLDRTNTTAIDGFVQLNDDGVIVLNKNDTALLETILEKYEVRYYLSKKRGTYLAGFREIVTKPWENPVSQWRNSDGEPLVSIFSQAELTSNGLAIGKKIEDRFLSSKKLNVSKFRVSISKSDILLTDNYDLEEKLKGYTAMRYSIGGELAYKYDFRSISRNSALIFALYGNYDKYDYSKDDDSTTDNDITLSNDYRFGARVALSF